MKVNFGLILDVFDEVVATTVGMIVFEVKVFDDKNNSSLVGVLKRHNNGQRPKTHRHNSFVTTAITVSRIFIEKVLMFLENISK